MPEKQDTRARKKSIGSELAILVEFRPEFGYVFGMSTLTEIERAAEALPADQQDRLLMWLLDRARERRGDGPPPRHSVLDIAPVSLGRVIRPLSSDDDLLGEMLEERQ